jgi:hypothetical protein
MTLRTIAVAAALLVAAGTARAQDTASVAGKHDNAIALGVGPTPSIGLWHRLTPNLELGVEVTGQHNGASDDNDQGFRLNQLSLQPAVKAYLGPAAPVRPYAYAEAGITFAKSRYNVTLQTGPAIAEMRDRGLGAGVGLGVEWAAFDRVSIGGHAGVQGTWLRERDQIEDNPGTVSHFTRYNTFSSGVRIQLYF